MGRKITSFQRRWNLQRAMDYQVKRFGESTWAFIYLGRFRVAQDRRDRRFGRRLARRKLPALKPCVPIPCPPFRKAMFTTTTAE